MGRSLLQRLGFGAAVAVATVSPGALAVAQAVGKRHLRPRRAPQGGSGDRINAGLIDDIDANPDVRGRKWMAIANEMLRDGHVRKSLDYISDPLCQGMWSFDPVSDSPLDMEVADACKWAFFERLPWRRTLRRMVVGYGAYGISLHEVTDDSCPLPVSRFPLHPGHGFGVVPTGLHERPARSIYRYHQRDGHPDQLESITQEILGSDTEEYAYQKIDANRCVRLTYDQEGADFAGMAVLRSAYAPWKLKKAFQFIDAISHERNGIGTPVMTLPPGVETIDIEAAQDTLAEMRDNEKGFLILGDGYKFEWINSSKSDGTNLNEAIQRCNIDIAYNVTAGHMLLGLTGSSGSYALGSTQEGAYHLTVSAHGQFVTGALNNGQDGWSPVKRFVALNYGPDVPVPLAQVTDLPTRNWLEVVKRYSNGVSVGSITPDRTTENHIRRLMQIGPHDPSTAIARVGGETETATAQEEAEDDA